MQSRHEGSPRNAAPLNKPPVTGDHEVKPTSEDAGVPRPGARQPRRIDCTPRSPLGMQAPEQMADDARDGRHHSSGR
ncbi:MAG TPA: hypothetical protein VFZ21_30430 [Gemmatimonadaceae bacterium]|nr:hypothetical protein [Gemmatimonadaceae bacterium]